MTQYQAAGAFFLTSYTGMAGFVLTTPVEKAPNVHGMFHSYDPLLGRGYHFKNSSQVEQVDLIIRSNVI